MRILIAEDDPVSRHMLAGMLNEWGYSVVAACNGTEAWEILQFEHAPKLVIFDRIMPGMDGVTVCQRIREISAPRPPYIILLTIKDKKEDIVEGLQDGADDYVTKPFDREELRARVQVGVRIIELQGELVNRLRELEDAFLQIKQNEEELRNSEARLNAIVEAAADGIITIDEHGMIQSFNSAAARVFGYAPGEVIGHNVKVLMPEPYHSKHDDYMVNYLKTEAKNTTGSGRELVGLRKNEATFPMELAVSEVHVGDHILFTAIVRDVTERRAMDRMKDEFISTVSHELRTPLSSIHASLGLLMGGAAGELPEKTMDLLDIAYNNSQRLAHLVNDILDIEKLDSGRMPLDLRPLELMPLIEQAIEENSDYAGQFGTTLVLESASPDAKINVDRDRLMQVFANLLSNAAKYSPPNDEVLITISRSGEVFRVAIADHGLGIPEKFHSRVFERFARADTPDNRQKSGTGLGLSITKAIVEKHGGTIGFETEVGVGTTFYFDLPEWHE